MLITNLNIGFNVLVIIALIFMYNDIQRLDITKPDCTTEINKMNIKLDSYELKLDRMHQILKMKTYNSLLNQKRKIK